jgi:hypothetical protein
MADRWGAVLQLVAANTAYAGLVGYAVGRGRPIRRARNWADSVLAFGDPATTGRLARAAVIALLPEVFIPLLWHRLRHGEYPQPPPRRSAPVPALVLRDHTDRKEGR